MVKVLSAMHPLCPSHARISSRSLAEAAKKRFFQLRRVSLTKPLISSTIRVPACSKGRGRNALRLPSFRLPLGRGSSRSVGWLASFPPLFFPTWQCNRSRTFVPKVMKQMSVREFGDLACMTWPKTCSSGSGSKLNSSLTMTAAFRYVADPILG